MRVLLAALLLTVAGQAHAACEQTDLTGEWTAYLTFTTPSGLGMCNFEIGPGGRLRNSTCSSFAGSGRATGEFNVDQTCAVTGNFTFNDKLHSIMSAKMRGRAIFGLGYAFFSFTMLKD